MDKLALLNRWQHSFPLVPAPFAAPPGGWLLWARAENGAALYLRMVRDENAPRPGSALPRVKPTCCIMVACGSSPANILRRKSMPLIAASSVAGVSPNDAGRGESVLKPASSHASGP